MASQATEAYIDESMVGPKLTCSLPSSPITIYGLGTMIGAGRAGLFAAVSRT